MFAFSSSAQPLEFLDSVNIAKQHSVTTVSLTRAGSSLVKRSELVIELDLHEDWEIYKPSASRLVLVAIIDVLASGAARKLSERVKD